MLLGILIRHVTNEYHGDFFHNHIFEPLGMKSARVISESDIVPNRASGYACVDGTIKNQEWVSPTVNTFADGDLYLNIHDMIAWETALNTDKLLKSKESFDTMWSPAKLNNGCTTSYGFGWDLTRTIHGMRVARHVGSWQGFQSMIIHILEARTTVVLFTNLNTAEVDAIASHLLAMYDSQLVIKSSDDKDE